MKNALPVGAKSVQTYEYIVGNMQFAKEMLLLLQWREEGGLSSAAATTSLKQMYTCPMKYQNVHIDIWHAGTISIHYPFVQPETLQSKACLGNISIYTYKYIYMYI